MIDLPPVLQGALADRPEAWASGRCLTEPIGCGRSLEEVPWRDTASATEYRISGLCQQCQDKVFPRSAHCTCSEPCCEADVGVGIITCGGQHCPLHGLDEFVSAEVREARTKGRPYQYGDEGFTGSGRGTLDAPQ